MSAAAIFDFCSANLGGALCSIGSPIYLKNVQFKNNTAYKYGGGIYFQRIVSKDDPTNVSPTHKLIIQQLTLTGNKANEYGGAICLSSPAEVDFEDSTCQNNHAAFAGGAIYSHNTDNLKIFNTKFYQNTLQNNVFRQFSGQSISGKTNLAEDQYNTRFRARGGGAICVASDDKKLLTIQSKSVFSIHTRTAIPETALAATLHPSVMAQDMKLCWTVISISHLLKTQSTNGPQVINRNLSPTTTKAVMFPPSMIA